MSFRESFYRERFLSFLEVLPFFADDFDSVSADLPLLLSGFFKEFGSLHLRVTVRAVEHGCFMSAFFPFVGRHTAQISSLKDWRKRIDDQLVLRKIFLARFGLSLATIGVVDFSFFLAFDEFQPPLIDFFLELESVLWESVEGDMP